MKRDGLFWRTLCVAAIVLAAGCSESRVHYMTDFRYPAQPPGAQIETFYGRVQQPHEVFAILQSVSYSEDSKETKGKMLENLQFEARRIGADAVENIRLLNTSASGYVSDPDTPFPSVKQSASARFFLRGDAIKYIDPHADLGQPFQREPLLEME